VNTEKLQEKTPDPIEKMVRETPAETVQESQIQNSFSMQVLKAPKPTDKLEKKSRLT